MTTNTPTPPPGWPAIGDKSVCRDCGRPIVFLGRYWGHEGDWHPRHIARPAIEKKHGTGAQPDAGKE